MSNYLGAYWNCRPLSLGDYVESLKSFLLTLQQLHPLFKELYEVGNEPNDETLIADDLSNLVAVARQHAWDKKAPGKWYSRLDADGKPTLESTSETGYSLLISNGAESKKGENYVYLSIRAGTNSQWLSDAVVIGFSEADGAPFLDRELATKLMESVVEHWHPDRALISSDGFRKHTYSQDDGGSIGWINYFANPSVATALSNTVANRTFGSGGGVLIVTAPHMPSASDAEASATAIQVAELLRSQNLMV